MQLPFELCIQYINVHSVVGNLIAWIDLLCLNVRTVLEERDLHVDHCNQALQETQAHYATLSDENTALKAEVEKLERVMLMQVRFKSGTWL